MHSHILPKTMPNWTQKFGYGKFIHLEPNADGSANMMQGGQFFRRIVENCWDEQLRIEEYKPFHTQVQVVCTIPVMFSYWAKTADALELSRFLNDHIAELVTRYPNTHFDFHAHNDYDLSVANVLEAVNAGIKGLHLTVNGMGERAGNAPLASTIAVQTAAKAVFCFVSVRSRTCEGVLVF